MFILPRTSITTGCCGEGLYGIKQGGSKSGHRQRERSIPIQGKTRYQEEGNGRICYRQTERLGTCEANKNEI